MPASTDLDIKYRPKTLDAVVGQSDAVGVVRGFGADVPRALLFHGRAGAGKTTIARIIVRKVLDVSRMDCVEVNCGTVEKPLDMVRELAQSVTQAPMTGAHRAWVMDEFQAFSKNRFAMEGFLKILEDSPPHVHFLLCSTDPDRILKAIRTRCVQIPLRDVPAADLARLVLKIAAAENADPPVTQQLADRIAAAADGSARVAVKELEKVIHLADPAARLAAVAGLAGEGTEEFKLVQELLPWRGAANWDRVAAVLDALKESDPEGLRRMILSSARGQLLKPGFPGKTHAYNVIRALADPLFDRSSGHALLAAGCFRAVVPAAK